MITTGALSSFCPTSSLCNITFSPRLASRTGRFFHLAGIVGKPKSVLGRG